MEKFVYLMDDYWKMHFHIVLSGCDGEICVPHGRLLENAFQHRFVRV